MLLSPPIIGLDFFHSLLSLHKRAQTLAAVARLKGDCESPIQWNFYYVLQTGTNYWSLPICIPARVSINLKNSINFQSSDISWHTHRKYTQMVFNNSTIVIHKPRLDSHINSCQVSNSFNYNLIDHIWWFFPPLKLVEPLSSIMT